MRVIVLAFSFVASSLTLAAPSSTPALPQEQEQRGVDTKETSSDAEPNKVSPTKKTPSGLDAEPFERSYPGFRGLGKRFLEDQEQILTSPAKLRFSDTQWLVPLSGVAAGLFITDASYSRRISQNPATLSHYKTLSDAGVGALIGGAGGMWLLGHVRHNAHWSETGFLSGEAALNSLVLVESLKYSLRRERPYQGNGTGPFFQNGGTSFPSEHAAAAWSVAGVIAHEYPSPFVKIMAYGLASLVDYSRVRARQHFPSDVFVGSIMGNLIAQNVYSRHHDPELGGEAWRSISHVFRGDGTSSSANQGSPYVPLDSWVYPALDRLMALGVVDSGFAGMRPWTRSECARLLGEAGENIDEEGAGGAEAEKIYRLLQTEFREEIEGSNGAGNFRARVESVYSRVTGISGQPLTDGYHFGQTILNDYGRPYQQGLNSADGFSAWTTSGRWVAYVRAEYEHAPSAPALSATARQTIASVDSIPVVPPAAPFAAVNRMQLLDAYVGMNFENWQVTFGKQSLWWGPGDSGPMMFSDNVEPINMFRVNRVSPFQLPSFLKRLGPVRTDFFIGQLDGHHFVDTASGITGSWSQQLNPQPFIDGWKLSFKPTANLEFGLTYTTIFGGVGNPATPRTFVQSLFDAGGDLPDGSSKSSRENGLDFSYRIPKLRKWLTLYGEGFAHDQIIFFIDPKAKPLPFGYPDRAAWRAGIYVPMFPGIRKLDFRVEGGYTSNPLGPSGGYASGFYYTANRYLNGYTNNGNLLGSWLGRAGQGEQAWTNYWFTGRSRIQLNFRHQTVSQQYLPGGGSLTDVGLRGDYWLGSVGISAWVQHESWLFPVIQPNVSRNVTATVQILFEPRRLFQHFAPSAPGATSAAGGRP
jgi:membrane-associated phospholipid phosphatase